MTEEQLEKAKEIEEIIKRFENIEELLVEDKNTKRATWGNLFRFLFPRFIKDRWSDRQRDIYFGISGISNQSKSIEDEVCQDLADMTHNLVIKYKNILSSL